MKNKAILLLGVFGLCFGGLYIFIFTLGYVYSNDVHPVIQVKPETLEYGCGFPYRIAEYYNEAHRAIKDTERDPHLIYMPPDVRLTSADLEQFGLCIFSNIRNSRGFEFIMSFINIAGIC